MCVFQGEFVACLLTLLRQLKDKEYQQLLSRFPTKDELTVQSFDKPYQSALRLFNQLFNNSDCCSRTLQSGFPEFPPAVIHCLQNTYPIGYVPQRLDCHETGR